MMKNSKMKMKDGLFRKMHMSGILAQQKFTLIDFLRIFCEIYHRARFESLWNQHPRGLFVCDKSSHASHHEIFQIFCIKLAF